MFRNLLIISFLIVSFSCSKSKKEFGDFDFTTWKSDRGACDSKRINMLESLNKYKSQLIGLSENEVFDYLGRYDMELLDNRNKKAFIYFLEKGPQCETPKKATKARSMVLRFNAISMVSEVEFMEGIPL